MSERPGTSASCAFRYSSSFVRSSSFAFRPGIEKAARRHRIPANAAIAPVKMSRRFTSLPPFHAFARTFPSCMETKRLSPGRGGGGASSPASRTFLGRERRVEDVARVVGSAAHGLAVERAEGVADRDQPLVVVDEEGAVVRRLPRVEGAAGACRV